MNRLSYVFPPTSLPTSPGPHLAQANAYNHTEPSLNQPSRPTHSYLICPSAPSNRTSPLWRPPQRQCGVWLARRRPCYHKQRKRQIQPRPTSPDVSLSPGRAMKTCPRTLKTRSGPRWPSIMKGSWCCHQAAPSSQMSSFISLSSARPKPTGVSTIATISTRQATSTRPG